MIHYIYKITHNNGHFYYGRHSTNNLDDGYMGSGNWVKSVKDKNNLFKEIIEFASSTDKLKQMEQKYIDEHYGKQYCMNFSTNSSGGFFASGKNHPSYGKPAVNKNVPMSKEQKLKISKSMTGKKITDVHKNKIITKLTKKWIVVDPKGILYNVDTNFKQFCLNNKLTYNSMLLVSRGKRLQHKGWKCIKNDCVNKKPNQS